ncbi:hypothetical protein [Flammeovirga pacifica]|nr:hypothetical protein [Flammeovirga pacifica]
MKESDTPDFNIINKKGNKIKKVDFRGKVIVLIIASSWSIEFLEDFDQIKSLQKETWNKDVVFLYAIADVQNNWESFLREYSAPKLDNSLENTYILPISSPYCNDCFMTNHFKQEEIPSYYVFSKSGDLIGENIPRKSILTGMKSLILGARNLSYK